MKNRRRVAGLFLILLTLLVVYGAVFVVQTPDSNVALARLNALQFEEPEPPMSLFYGPEGPPNDELKHNARLIALLTLIKPYEKSIKTIQSMPEAVRDEWLEMARNMHWQGDWLVFCINRSGVEHGRLILWQTQQLLEDDIKHRYAVGDTDSALRSLRALFSLSEAFTSAVHTIQSLEASSRGSLLDMLASNMDEDRLTERQLILLRRFAAEKCNRDFASTRAIGKGLKVATRAARKDWARGRIDYRHPLKSDALHIWATLFLDKIPLVGDSLEEQRLARYYENLCDILILTGKSAYWRDLCDVYQTWLSEYSFECLEPDVSPAFDKLFEQAFVEADYRMLYVAVSVNLFRQSKGRYPTSLTELASVIDVNEDMLIDPFSGEQIRYRVENAAFTLYSVGFDGEDANGKALERGGGYMAKIWTRTFDLRTEASLRNSGRLKEGDRIWGRLLETAPPNCGRGTGVEGFQPETD